MCDNIVMASMYRITAVNFAESARVLSNALLEKEKQVSGNIMAIPFYYLVSHAAELFLKCALLKRSTSMRELKSVRLRHSLTNLLDELLSKGVPISDATRDLIIVLNQQHETHALRYTALLANGEPTFTPPPDRLFVMLDELMMAGRIATHGV